MHFQLSIVSVLALAASSVLASEFVSQNAAARAAMLARRDASPEAPFVSQNALARQAALQRRTIELQDQAVLAPVRRAHAAHARRSVSLDGGRRFIARRATPAQLAAQQKLNEYAAQLAKTNTEWQKAVMIDLKAGKTPQNFDEFAAGQPAVSVSSSSSAHVSVSSSSEHKSTKKPASLATDEDEQDDEDEENDDDEDEDDEDEDDDEEDDDDDSGDDEEEEPTPKPAPKPKQQQPAPKPKPEPKPETPKQSSGGSNGGSSSAGGPVSKGDGTFYATGLGACGETNNDSQFIAAIAADRYDSKGVSNSSAQCGRQIEVCRGEKCTKVTVKDRCQGCKWDDLDMSPDAFKAIAKTAEGRVGITWKFLDGKP